jgi:hypothetical protein
MVWIGYTTLEGCVVKHVWPMVMTAQQPWDIAVSGLCQPTSLKFNLKCGVVGGLVQAVHVVKVICGLLVDKVAIMQAKPLQFAQGGSTLCVQVAHIHVDISVRVVVGQAVHPLLRGVI